MTLNDLLNVLDDDLPIQIVSINTEGKKDKDVVIQKKIIVSQTTDILSKELLDREVSKVEISRIPTSPLCKITII